MIELNMDRIAALCRRYKVAKLWVFGSILTPRFNDDSDVDFIVEFDRNRLDLLDYADNFFDFIDSLKDVFKREIDLVVDSSIRNPYFRKEVDNTRRLVWKAM